MLFHIKVHISAYSKQLSRKMSTAIALSTDTVHAAAPQLSHSPKLSSSKRARISPVSASAADQPPVNPVAGSQSSILRRFMQLGDSPLVRWCFAGYCSSGCCGADGSVFCASFFHTLLSHTSFTHFFHTLLSHTWRAHQHSSISIHRDTDATSHAALKQHCKQHCKDAQGHAQGHLNDLASE